MCPMCGGTVEVNRHKDVDDQRLYVAIADERINADCAMCGRSQQSPEHPKQRLQRHWALRNVERARQLLVILPGYLDTAFETLTVDDSGDGEDGGPIIPKEASALRDEDVDTAAEAIALASSALRTAGVETPHEVLLEGDVRALAGDILAFVLEQVGTGIQQWQLDGGAMVDRIAEKLRAALSVGQKET